MLRTLRRAVLALAAASVPVAVIGSAAAAAPAQAGAGDPITRASDVDPEGECKAIIQAKCASVQKGDGAIANCVVEAIRAARSRKEEMPATSACQMELRRFKLSAMRASSNAADLWVTEPISGIRAACKEDATNLCPTLSGMALSRCLRSKKLQLSAACREKIFQLQMQLSEDLALSPFFVDACKDELARIPACQKASEAPVREACLKGHRLELGETCRKALFKREVETGEDIRLNRDVFESCKDEISTSCGNKEYGEARMLQCLWEKSSITSGPHRFSLECQDKVVKSTIRSVQDYRLDFRTRTKCEKDIDNLCSQEKAEVDRLSMAELFGTEVGDYSAKSGKVLLCLKMQMSQITNGFCKEEMQRVVRVQALHSKADAVHTRECQDDIRKFCPSAPPFMVHSCLRKHLDEISPGCKSQEILQGKVESTSIDLKPQLVMACRGAMDEFCHGISPGNAQVLRCLQDKRFKRNFPAKCAEAVDNDLEASNHDWRLKYGMSHECLEDVNMLCQPERQRLKYYSVLTCLKEAYNNNSIHRRGCQQEVLRFISQGVNDIRMAPNTYKYCVHDVGSFCDDVEPGSGRVHECLLEHKAQLSLPCAKAEFDVQETRANDIRADPQAAKMCAEPIEKYCSGEQSGNGKVWQCLKDNADKPGFPRSCLTAVNSMIKLQHSEFHLNVGMAKHCEKDVNIFCNDERLDSAESRDFSSDGEVITCLIEHRMQLTDSECKMDVLKKAKERVQKVSLDINRKEQCEEDIDEFCPDVKDQEGLVHTCLAMHYKELTDPCQQVQKQYMKDASSDIRINTALQKTCRAATKKFCSDIQAGESRVINCLLGNKFEEGMDSACREALVKEETKRTADYDFNVKTHKICWISLIHLWQRGQCDQSREDWQMVCLTDHVGIINSTACKIAVRATLARWSADLRARPGMEAACQADIESLCSHVEAGASRLHQCLREKENQIQSTACKREVNSFAKVASTRASVNFEVKNACANEMKVYCKDVPPGDSRMMVCLKVHVEKEGFSDQCKLAIGKVTALEQTTVMMQNFTKKKMGFGLDDISEFIKDHESFTDKWGGLLLTGTIAFTAIAAFGCSYCILKKKFLKVMYTVAQPHEPDYA